MIELQIPKNLIFMAGIKEYAKNRAKITGMNLWPTIFPDGQTWQNIFFFFCTFAEYVVRELELVKVVEKAGRGPLATRVKGAATPLEW